MKRVFLAVIFLFCFIGNAAADGNWVLWQHVVEESNDHWTIEEGYLTYDSCIKEQQRNLEILHAETNGSSIKKNKYGSTSKIEWKCLPDIINPRK